MEFVKYVSVRSISYGICIHLKVFLQLGEQTLYLDTAPNIALYTNLFLHRHHDVINSLDVMPFVRHQPDISFTDVGSWSFHDVIVASSAF